MQKTIGASGYCSHFSGINLMMTMCEINIEINSKKVLLQIEKSSQEKFKYYETYKLRKSPVTKS